MSDIVWRSFKVAESDVGWEPASYNVQWEDGKEYGRWRCVLRKHSHGLTVISRYTAPPGKAWKIVGKDASARRSTSWKAPTTTARVASLPGRARSCSTRPEPFMAASPAT